MPGPYDDNVKKLIDANPQDFVTLALGGGHFEKVLPHKLQSVHIFADALLKITLEGKPSLLHIEFQSSNDSRMQERLLEYNILASREHDYLPVCSCVIFLRKGGTIPKSPFIRKLPTGEEMVRFHYRSIELWRIPSQELLRNGLVGLLPLVPLTQGGTRHEAVEEMISELVSVRKTELLLIAWTIASLAFENESEAEQKWLERTFAMLNDTLRNTRAYQKILKEGREEALRQELQRQRQALLDVVQKRFPELVPLMKEKTDAIEDPTILLHLIVKISTAQTSEEAEQLLLNKREDEEQNNKP